MAVYWQPGEWHETGTNVGLVAIVVEGDVLEGARRYRACAAGSLS